MLASLPGDEAEMDVEVTNEIRGVQMARKVILDMDPGVDDALALVFALFHPGLDVVAVTAVGGNCSPVQATRNVQAIVEAVDPPRLPRLGAASEPEPEIGLPPEGRGLYGPDGLGGATLPVAERQHMLPAEKVICDQVRTAPDAITIVALGPLTNVARAFQRDPELPSLVGRVVMAGGAVAVSGNYTSAAEFNIYCDPPAARSVFRFGVHEDVGSLGCDEPHNLEFRPVSPIAR